MQFAFDPTPKKPAAKTPRRLSKRASRKAAAPAPTASQGSLTTNRSQLFVAAAKQRAVNEHFAELDGDICGEESGEWFGSSFKGPGKNIESEVCTKAKGHDGWHDGGGSTWAPKSAKRKTAGADDIYAVECLHCDWSSNDSNIIDRYWYDDTPCPKCGTLEVEFPGYGNPDEDLFRYMSRKTAATAPGYYLVGRASNIIEGPFGSLVQAEARQPEVKAAAIEYKSGVEDPQWESMKAQPFPYGLNTVNGSRRKVANQYVEKRGDKWVVTQKGTGKVLSTHDTKEKAEASFRAMMVNKHGGSRKTSAKPSPRTAGEGAYVTDSHNSGIRRDVPAGAVATPEQGYSTFMGTVVYDWSVEGIDGDGWQLGGSWSDQTTASRKTANGGR